MDLAVRDRPSREQTTPAMPLAQALQEALDEAIAKLPIPKLMSYQLADGVTTVNFVRPAHGLVALHGTQVVPIRALGLESGRAGRERSASWPSR